MHIGYVGGLSRNDTIFEQLAVDAGHKLELHTGDIRGQGAKALRMLVKRSSLVIILTTINSHGGVQLAKRMAQKHNRPAVVMPRCGQNRFRQILATIDRSTVQDAASKTVS